MTDELPLSRRITHRWRITAHREGIEEMECPVCGVTGKSYNKRAVIRDIKYHAVAFFWCNTALEHIENRALIKAEV